ncbi:MAG: MATE family efflux transporter [Pseudomonadota bacterium]
MRRWGSARPKISASHEAAGPDFEVASGPSFQGPPGGYREVLRIAVPLILSTASVTVTLFADRMFLSWYSLSAVAASTPGGIMFFTICSFFLGTAQYVNTLVAQHHGSNDKPACSRAVWQGVWFAFLSFPLILAAIPVGAAVLARSGHDPDLVRLETEYFSILMLGGAALPFNAALASFFSGRGKTRVVMWGNLMGNAANVLLDYLLIFGNLGFPEMGIRGAAIATAVTGIIPPVFWACLFLSRKYQPHYRSRNEMCLDRRLFELLLRYGVPSGVQFFLDVASFTAFILLIGRLGETDLAATNIVLSIEMLSFLPMVGMSIATAILVGEYIGRSDLRTAERSVYSALRMALAYSGILAVLYFLIPEVFIGVFRYGVGNGPEFDAVAKKAVVILRLIAVFTVFDTVFIVFSGALKGAGDTKFAMWAQIIAAWVFFVPPVYVIVEILDMGVTAAWCWGVAYVVALGTIFWRRFHSGRWKSIRMIEVKNTNNRCG